MNIFVPPINLGAKADWLSYFRPSLSVSSSSSSSSSTAALSANNNTMTTHGKTVRDDYTFDPRAKRLLSSRPNFQQLELQWHQEHQQVHRQQQQRDVCAATKGWTGEITLTTSEGRDDTNDNENNDNNDDGSSDSDNDNDSEMSVYPPVTANSRKPYRGCQYQPMNLFPTATASSSASAAAAVGYNKYTSHHAKPRPPPHSLTTAGISIITDTGINAQRQSIDYDGKTGKTSSCSNNNNNNNISYYVKRALLQNPQLPSITNSNNNTNNNHRSDGELMRIHPLSNNNSNDNNDMKIDNTNANTMMSSSSSTPPLIPFSAQGNVKLLKRLSKELIKCFKTGTRLIRQIVNKTNEQLLLNESSSSDITAVAANGNVSSTKSITESTSATSVLNNTTTASAVVTTMNVTTTEEDVSTTHIVADVMHQLLEQVIVSVSTTNTNTVTIDQQEQEIDSEENNNEDDDEEEDLYNENHVRELLIKQNSQTIIKLLKYRLHTTTNTFNHHHSNNNNNSTEYEIILPKPLTGWQHQEQAGGGGLMWKDYRRCFLCHEGTTTSSMGMGVGFESEGSGSRHENTTDPYLGRLLVLHDGRYCHVNCLRWSNGVTEQCGGFLSNAHLSLAEHLKSKVTCNYCKQKGASITCAIPQCVKNYHLKCAIACHFSFFECRLANSDTSGVTAGDNNDAPHDIHTIVVCPEHYSRYAYSHFLSSTANANLSNTAHVSHHHHHHSNRDNNALTSGPVDTMAYDPKQLKLNNFRWIPHNPLRLLTTECAADKELAFTYLAQQLVYKKSDAGVKCGSFVIIDIGTPRINSVYFHTSVHIFPFKYKSLRIFWSMLRPLQRTTYMFDIISESVVDSLGIDVRQIQSVVKTHNNNNVKSSSGKSIHQNQNQSNKGVAAAANTNDDVVMDSNKMMLQDDGGNEEEEDEEEEEDDSPSIDYSNLFFSTNILVQGHGSSSHNGVVHDNVHYNEDDTDADRINANTNITGDLDNDGRGNNNMMNHSEDKPIFRVLIGDDPHRFILARTIEDAYDAIVYFTRACNNQVLSNFMTRGGNNDAEEGGRCVGTYGLNASHFFGLGLPFVRHAIELKLESIYAMTQADTVISNTSTATNSAVNTNIVSNNNSVVSYRPCYHLPTKDAFLRLQQVINAISGVQKVSLNGSARADAYETDAVFQSKRLTLSRSLTKSSGSGNTDILTKSAGGSSNDKSNDEGEEDEEDAEGGQRKQERYQLQYKELSEAYLKNPYAKLTVKRSLIHGWGLFAKTHFSKDDMIVEYIGEKIRQVGVYDFISY